MIIRLPSISSIVGLSLAASPGLAQSPATATGWQLTGIPALNFDADEGFGYGALVQAYDYGTARTSTPYLYTIQPTLFFTTKGRRDVSVFVDAPHLVAGWRVSAYAARLQQLAAPYYGIGNATVYTASAEQAPNPYFYRFGREGVQLTADVQHTILPSTRILVGAGVRTTNINETPFDSGTTLIATQMGGSPIPSGRTSYGRVGLVFDTRDREIGTQHGAWIEGIAQRAVSTGGSPSTFTRATVTARGYVSPNSRLTIAERVIAQNVWGTTPFYELSDIQSSYQDIDGNGGSATIRGLPKDRFVGKGLALINNEARYRAADFGLLGRPSSLVVIGFVDAGRVWAEQLDVSQLGSGLHTGVGGGLRLQYGPSFTIAADVAHSTASTAPLYVGLGYLF